MSTCLRCETHYPERRGKKFCSTKCRVYYDRQVKKQYVSGAEVILEELRLKRLLLEVVALAELIHCAVHGREIQAGELVPSEVTVFINHCASLLKSTAQEREKSRAFLSKQAAFWRVDEE